MRKKARGLTQVATRAHQTVFLCGLRFFPHLHCHLKPTSATLLEAPFLDRPVNAWQFILCVNEPVDVAQRRTASGAVRCASSAASHAYSCSSRCAARQDFALRSPVNARVPQEEHRRNTARAQAGGRGDSAATPLYAPLAADSAASMMNVVVSAIFQLWTHSLAQVTSPVALTTKLVKSASPSSLCRFPALGERWS